MGPPWAHRNNKIIYFLTFIFCITPICNAGCYSEGLCCLGRNISCKAKDDGVDHISNFELNPPVKLVKFQGEEYPPVLSEDGQRIGRLILPDVVEIDNDTLRFSEQFPGHAEFLTALDGEEYRRKYTLPPRQETSRTKTLTEIIFGYPFNGKESPESTIIEWGRPIIRLSTLNRYLPVKVGQVEDIATPLRELKEGSDYPVYDGLMFLEESNPDCFCDEQCVKYGDCCSDYTFICLPTDCQHYKHLKTMIPNRNHTNYCVRYKLGWVNRNCVEKQFKYSLVRGHEICTECQPEAQYHRNTPRCASDLEDGQRGFWKVVGPISCYGIWYRQHRTNDCSCKTDPHLKTLDRYLIV
uniref:SMB domain-containing protein n=1 Tax=Panagrolaimus sp. JU765 TaxID=591449 RepID=A0AC34RIV9_9BILA